MINTNNVVHILSNLISKHSTSMNRSSPPITPREEELAHHLLNSIESISNCSSYTIENDTTLELDTTAEEFNNECGGNDSDDKSYDDNCHQED